MNDIKQLPGITLPEGYEPTPVSHYSYFKFADWWPMKWKGPAWMCPEGHQMPKEKFDFGFYQGNRFSTFCPGCGRWIDRKTMTWATIEKQCTMGYARRKSEIEEDIEEIETDGSDSKAVQTRNEVPTRGKDRKRRSTGTAPGDTVDSRKNRRRKSKRIVGS